MKIDKLTRNPYLLFSPFLLLFVVFVLIYHTDVLKGDAGGYIYFANNLLHGFYSPPAPDINLWWGPGYPIILMPFKFLNLPLICITLLNAIFQYLSIVFLFKALIKFVKFQKAFLFSIIWAFCYSSYSNMASIATESFTLFLISIFVYSLVKTFVNDSRKYLFLAGFILGYLALTKVIFGYVILSILVGCVLLWAIKRNNNNYRRSLLIMLVALLTTIPYLFYTYNLTSKLFYWGNSGGMTLYWMSSPYINEYGAWDNETFDANLIDLELASSNELLRINHQTDIDEITKYTGVQKDDAYKRIALKNIKTHPIKYFKNIMANISRMLFGFPGNFTYQRPLLKIWYFAVLYTLMVFCFLLSIINWNKLSYCIRFIFVFTFIYLGGTSLLGAGNRQFVIIVPTLLFWIAYIIDKYIILKTNQSK